MLDELNRKRLETRALVVGYAMSRLDAEYLTARQCRTWTAAYQEAADALGAPPASFKNLRDEFDPMHPNARRGWHQRSLRVSRQRVVEELSEVSNDALLELVARIVAGEHEETDEAVDALAIPPRVAANVAERLLTGRKAEDYFLANCYPLVRVTCADIVDCRLAARGFDFGVRGNADRAIEVKGLRGVRGPVQFTDREWTEARWRREQYTLVVVGNLAAAPTARVIADPWSVITAQCSYQHSVSAVWRATVDVGAS